VTVRPIVPRAAALWDVEAAVDYYSDEAGTDIALKFIDALERAYRAISVHPATGSPRYAHELDIPGLRSRKLTRFPHRVFYFEREDHIDIWRVLHAQRDIASWLGAFED
jgi:toxin ParE1/3/4